MASEKTLLHKAPKDPVLADFSQRYTPCVYSIHADLVLPSSIFCKGLQLTNI